MPHRVDAGDINADIVDTDYSDLDLTIVADHKLDMRTLALLKLDCEESDLPFGVYILDWHAANDEFQKVIEKEYEIILIGAGTWACPY